LVARESGLELQTQPHLDLADVVGEVAVVGGGHLAERRGIGSEGVAFSDGGGTGFGGVVVDEVGRGVHRSHVLVVGEVEGLGEEFERVVLADDQALGGAEVEDPGLRLLEVVAVEDGNAVDGAGADGASCAVEDDPLMPTE